MTSPTEQWIRGASAGPRRHRLCLWLNARVVEPGLRPHRDAQHLTILVWDHAVATRGSSNLVPTWAALSGELPPTISP